MKLNGLLPPQCARFQREFRLLKNSTIQVRLKSLAQSMYAETIVLRRCDRPERLMAAMTTRSADFLKCFDFSGKTACITGAAAIAAEPA